MAILDTILDNFLRDRGLEDFRDPVQVEGRIASGKEAPKGQTFVLKEGPEGQVTRLLRPEDRPKTFFERYADLTPQRDFSGFLQDTAKNIGQGTVNILNKLGPITAFGSPYHAAGLDIDLQIGDPVPTPVSGVIESTGTRGGFGNQVVVRGDDGRQYFLSHLDRIDVQPGQRIGAGQSVGAGGNTGRVIPGPGGDGSHLDLTVKDPSGGTLGARQVRDLLQTFG